MDVPSLTIPELREKFISGALKPREAVDQLGARIAQVDPQIRAYNHLDLDKARAQADAANVALPLGGVPIAIKDVINVQGDPCTCSSKILQGYTAPYDATVITRLREAGAVLCGRTNMDEFAMGSSTENSAWGCDAQPVGPRAHSRRQQRRLGRGGRRPRGLRRARHRHRRLDPPARRALQLRGHEADLRRVSRYGLVAFASSLDQIGTFTKTTEESAMLLEILAGHDPRDNTSVDRPVPKYTQSLHQGVKGLRLGVPKEYFIAGHRPRDREGGARRNRRLQEPGRGKSSRSRCRTRSTPSPSTTSSRRPSAPPTSPASTACATASARRIPRTSSTCTAAPAPRASGPR